MEEKSKLEIDLKVAEINMRLDPYTIQDIEPTTKMLKIN